MLSSWRKQPRQTARKSHSIAQSVIVCRVIQHRVIREVLMMCFTSRLGYFLETMNRDFFGTHGLFAMLITFNPQQKDTMSMVTPVTPPIFAPTNYPWTNHSISTQEPISGGHEHSKAPRSLSYFGQREGSYLSNRRDTQGNIEQFHSVNMLLFMSCQRLIQLFIFTVGWI